MWHTDDSTTPFVLISIVVHHGQKDVGNSFEPPTRYDPSWDARFKRSGKVERATKVFSVYVELQVRVLFDGIKLS